MPEHGQQNEPAPTIIADYATAAPRGVHTERVRYGYRPVTPTEYVRDFASTSDRTDVVGTFEATRTVTYSEWQYDPTDLWAPDQQTITAAKAAVVDAAVRWANSRADDHPQATIDLDAAVTAYRDIADGVYRRNHSNDGR